jgi:hypothetical protein
LIAGWRAHSFVHHDVFVSFKSTCAVEYSTVLKVQLQRCARRVSLGLATVALLAMCGCNVTAGRLNGKVTYKGKTVCSGTVTCIGSDGIARYGRIQVDGTYKMSDMPTGRVKIAINSPDPSIPNSAGSPVVGQKRGGNGLEPVPETPPPDPKLWFEIPESASDADRSRITTKVKQGDNTFDIEIPG